MSYKAQYAEVLHQVMEGALSVEQIEQLIEQPKHEDHGDWHSHVLCSLKHSVKHQT